MGQPIQIIRKTANGENDHGLKTYTTTEITIDNALVGYGATSEPVEINRDPIDTHVTLYLPVGTVVLDSDEFRVNDEYWVKDGTAQAWQSMFGTPVGVVVYIRRRDG